MVELLAKHSKLKVEQAENGMTVRSNQVYLIPNDKFMTIQDHKLYLSAKEKIKSPHLTINTFFNSLAKDCGKKAIGIILSGLGSDGSEGIETIKMAGGMVIARNPETTEFGSMPSKAIATGFVDLVLEPIAMPDAIENYVNNAENATIQQAEDEKNIATIIELIKERSPLDFSDYKLPTILRRTKRRASLGNHTTLGSYLDFLKVTPEEVDALAKEFLISVTSFFRDKEAFGFIQKKVLPDILEKLSPGEELKVWVAGCATGEEASSIAILIAEQLTGKFSDIVVKIFATDIDSAALVRAGKGVYNKSISKNVPARLLEKYFLKEGDDYRLKPVIRKMLIFAEHDLVKNPPYCNMHMISCRNLLIYMAPVLQKKVFAMLLFGLKKDGYLFLGSSENPTPIIKNLEIAQKKWKIYKNLVSKRAVSFDAFSMPEFLNSKHEPSRLSRHQASENTNHSLSEAMHERLAENLDYLSICVDENNQVIKSYGDTTKYLLPKHFSSNLSELLPKPLAVAFNILSKKALKTKEDVSLSEIKIKQGQLIVKIRLSISPLKLKGEDHLLLVTFSEYKSAKSIQADPVFDEKVYLDQYVVNLEEELEELKTKLQFSNEKLDTSNENLQSFNEELISANEEMQSTNEEMQSVNEELHTINGEYQVKNKELIEINDDLNNYFRSNINGQLFIDNEMRLMKFSPGTVKQINLLETDIGRPLGNISTNIKFETIADDIKKVISNGGIITKEIETNNGKWYQIMTMPYLQEATNKNTGAIITFHDITELKQTQVIIAKKNKTLERINSDLDNFVHATSHDLLAPLGNIEMSIDMMNKVSLSDAKLMNMLKIINTSIKKFRVLITNIAVIAKVENDMIVTEMVDMEDIINNVEWSLENKISESNTNIIRKLEVTQILFSKKNLRSIVYNLISNAIKFRREVAPVITIRTWSEAEHFVLSVNDNGKGIPKGDIEQIFNIYGRLNQDIEGHGIGLYLAKKIVDAAGGNIIVESQLGLGSTFKIYLKI
ncbi:Chemotaxis protein methyltransferase CheR [Arcticibacter svalbardensis MN12-7]|uniref:histidine kinase n=2 Tax=Arcticibacter TaxID=1288026 RepID=R9GRB7_9SPHI|nr:Chemotaxis protein methyltransferase CheR [Arcticibacter svalbardensis MN12-7]